MTECNIVTQGGGGRSYGTLAEQIENFTVTPGDLSAVLTWTKPPSAAFDPHFVRVDIVRKVGSVPTKYRDGEIVYSGSGTTYTDTGLTAGKTYYYRAFAVNADGEIQTAERIVSTTACTVTIWEKWNSITKPIYLTESNYSTLNWSFYDVYSECKIDPETGIYTLTGSLGRYYAEDMLLPSVQAKLSYKPAKGDDNRTYYDLFAGNEPLAEESGSSVIVKVNYCRSVKSTTYAKGTTSYGIVTAIDPNAYPTNGRHTDGYWYIKKG